MIHRVKLTGGTPSAIRTAHYPINAASHGQMLSVCHSEPELYLGQGNSNLTLIFTPPVIV